jgi:hypothetical protein
LAAASSSSVAVVQALLAAYPEAATATTNVRRPSLLAAWMRGPERSSEVIICNQGQSGVIIRNRRALSGTQRALSGTQSHSVATRWAPQRPSAGPSEAIRGTQWLIRGDQRYSETLRGHQRPLRATQSHSVAFSGTQRHAEGPRHAVFTAPRSPCVASKHPVPLIRPTHVIAHSPSVLAAVFHAQYGKTPLHYAAASSSSVAVVQALLAAYPEAASARNNVRRPSPLAAWMRGPERSSEVIICNQGQSGVIIRNQRALSGTQRAISATQSHSVATRWAPQRPSAGPSVAIRGTQWLIRGDQRYSEALRGHQRPLRATQRHAVAFSGTQRRSEGLGTRSSPPLALRSVQAPCPSHPPHPRHRSSLLVCFTHRAGGTRPFTWPLRKAHRWPWCRRSSRRTRRPPRRGTMYAAPPPLPRG